VNKTNEGWLLEIDNALDETWEYTSKGEASLPAEGNRDLRGQRCHWECIILKPGKGNGE
jgi:hypothetical protein